MKAMVLHEPGKPFVLEERPIPEPKKNEAVAKVLACGSGLTIQHTVAGRIQSNFPIVIGHEITAEITEIGPEVNSLSVGDPVTAFYYLTCGDCKWCRINRETLCDNLNGQIGRHIDGGYAEYIKLPARNFIKLPEKLDYIKNPAEIGIITDAIATPYKVIRHAEISPMENIAIIGAGGGLGVHMVMVALWAGAIVTAVDISSKKLKKCDELGAHHSVNASQVNLSESLMELSNGQGMNVIVDFACTSSTIQSGIHSLGKGGRFLPMAGTSSASFKFNPKEMLKDERKILGSRYATKQEVIDSLDLVARGEMWPVVTEKYTLDEVDKVHERIEQGLVTGRAAIIIQ
ncbi:MAG: zinc-binding dehydrogenase [Nitrospinota bacterium]|nr:zinc-binding dehydrogenase [Nitrospinota bacterium]